MKTLGIIGATGRIGSAIAAAAPLVGWTVSLKADRHNGWAEAAAPQVIVDVSQRQALETVLNYCLEHNTPLVYGASGLTEVDRGLLRSTADQIAVLHAPNFAFGHHIQRQAISAMLRSAARRPRLWEAMVLERHPQTKRDAPSATAQVLALDVLCGGITPTDIQSVRGGLPVSDHAVVLTGTGEQLTLIHTVSDVSAAATGALLAAAWVSEAPHGYWSMDDAHGANEDTDALIGQ